jgi:hypothetical protein
MNIKKKSSKCKEFEYYIIAGEKSRECTPVAEHSTADRDVGGLNPPAPFDFQI